MLTFCSFIILLLTSIIFKSSPQIVPMKKHIFLDLEEGSVQPGNTVILDGTFNGYRVVQIRFIGSSNSCQGGIRPGSRQSYQCQPLVLRMYPKTHQVKIFYKGEQDNHLDVELYSRDHDSVAPGTPYRLQVKVGNMNYSIILNDELLTTVDDRIGSESIIKLRAYGGLFHEYYLDKGNEEIENCGTRPGLSSIAFRIVKGRKAQRGEFPWQAAIRRKTSTSWSPAKHMCGASLIGFCWVLTAAHCVWEIQDSLEYYVVRVGDYNNADNQTESDDYNEDQQDLEIESVFSHPDFAGAPSPRNDIALIKLKRSTCAKLSDLVRPICLPKPSDSFPEESTCEISGWGASNMTQHPLEFPTRLSQAKVEVRNKDNCRLNYGLDSHDQERVANKTICASGIRGEDSCQGDSGGPLACKRDQAGLGTNYVLWGVTSWGDGCGNRNRPGIYTKVLDYLEWIQRIMTTGVNEA